AKLAAAGGVFQGGQEGAGLVDAFLVFAVWGGVCDDAAAGLDVGYAVFDNHRAKRDAGIEIAGEIEIEDAAGVDAAASALDLFNNFHGTDFWRAGDGAGREARH